MVFENKCVGLSVVVLWSRVWKVERTRVEQTKKPREVAVRMLHHKDARVPCRKFRSVELPFRLEVNKSTYRWDYCIGTYHGFLSSTPIQAPSKALCNCSSPTIVSLTTSRGASSLDLRFLHIHPPSTATSSRTNHGGRSDTPSSPS